MNDAQAGSLRTTLLRLNRTIRELDVLLATEQVSEPIFYWKNHLTKEKKAEIVKRVAEIRLNIQRIAQAHGIEAEREDLLRHVWGNLSTHWVSIEDTKTEGLRRFGDVDPTLRETLDPQLENLSGAVNRLISALSL